MDKRAKVVMLPTAKEPYEMPYDKTIPKSNLILGLQESLNYSKTLGFAKSPDEDRFPSLHSIGNYSKQMYQHLYITSNDEIKEGDWYDDSYGNIRQAITIKTEYSIAYKKMVINVYYGENINSYHNLHEQMRKIIATTDSSLAYYLPEDINKVGAEHSLPQPSQSFITEFVEEYNKGNIITDVMVEYEEAFEHYKSTTEWELPKISKDNTITIRRVKDTIQVGEELYSIMQQYHDYCVWKEYITPMKWIEENL